MGALGDFVGWNFGDVKRNRSPEALAGNDWSDIMTYHPRSWVGPDTLKLLRGRLLQENELRALDLSKVRLPWGLFVSPPTSYLNLVGSNRAKFLYMIPLSLAPVAPGISKGLSVNVRDAQLKTWRKAHEAWGRAYESSCSGDVYFDILIPMNPRVTGIQVQWKKGRPVQFEIRPNNLWVEEICLAPENPRKPGSRMALVWKGPDPGKANVQYSVQQSRDGGAWETIAVGLLARSLPLNQVISPGSNTRFRIAVTGGTNSLMAEAPAVRCGAAPLR